MIFVTDVEARRDYSLIVTFSDGKVKRYDAAPLLKLDVYRPIRNITYFLTAHVDYGTVSWDHDTDVAPENLYTDGVEADVQDIFTQ
jgi:hypothetical protein